MYDYSFAEMDIAVHAFQIFSTIFNVVSDHPHLLREGARRKLYSPSRHIDYKEKFLGNYLTSTIIATEMLAGILNALCDFVQFSEEKGSNSLW